MTTSPRSGRRAYVTRKLMLRCGLGLSLCLVIGGATACSSSNTNGGSASTSPYKIGIIATLSGSLADYGQSKLAGVDAFASIVNKSGGINGHPLKIVPLDDTGDPSQGATDVSTLVNQGVIAIIGSNISSILTGEAPVAEAAKVALIDEEYTSAYTQPTSTGKYLFDAALNAVQGEQPVLFADGAKLVPSSAARRVAIAYSSNSTQSELIRAEDISLAKQNGWTVVAQIGYDPTQDSWDAENVALIKSKPDLIISSTDGGDLTSTAQALTAAGLHTPVLSYDTATTVSQFSAANYPDLYGVAGWHLPTDTQVPAVKKFNAAATAQHVQPGEDLTEAGYLDMSILAQALKECGASCSRPELSNAFYKISNFDANGLLFGPVSYSATKHIGLNKTALYHYVDGKMVIASL